jgi:hypothetical protein
LRVDEEKHQTSRSPSGLPTGESAVLRPADSQGGSTVTFYGDAARVREGFAIALGLLGLGAGVDGVSCGQAEDEDGDGE